MSALPETAVVNLAALHLPPFSEWTYKDAAAAVAAERPDWYGENYDFAELGDYWRAGAGWMGPTGDAAQKAAILARVEPQFVPVDAIGDALDNVENALLRREPRIDLVPVGLVTEQPDGTQTEAQKKAVEEAAAEASALKDQLAVWWDARRFHELLKLAVRRARWAARSYIRLWVPPGMLQARVVEGATAATTVIQANGIADALAKIHVEAIPADRAIIYTDPKTQARASVMLYQLDEKNFAEVSWVDGEWTIVRNLAESGGNEVDDLQAKMGGRLPLIGCETSLLITDAVRRQQKRLNFFETILVRNGETSGFPERVTINAESEGAWEPLSDSEDAGPYVVKSFNGTRYRLVPVPRTMGAAITTNLVGIVQGKAGEETMTTPSVERFDPVDPELTVKACDHAYRTLMRSCKQAHLANRGTGAQEASGTAYEQARAAFVADLDSTRGPVEGLTRETLAALLALAEHITRQPGEFTSRFRVVADLQVNAGPESPDALRLAMDAGGKGFLSRENVMARLGVEDPQAEIARIAAESEDSVALHDAVAAVMVKLEQAGVLTPDVAAAMMQSAGMPVEDAEKLAAEIRAAQAPAAGTPGSGLGTGGVPPIPGISG